MRKKGLKIRWRGILCGNTGRDKRRSRIKGRREDKDVGSFKER
ncbi:hypothetical protein AALA90_07035 [Lachnospiraceae bacterium 38-10]